MNAVTQTGSRAVAALQNIKTGLANVKAAIPTAGGDPFLKMGKDGMWSYGAEDVEVEEGSLWAVNILALEHGYCSWTRHPAESKKPNTLEGEAMVPMTMPKPDKFSLKETGWDWKDQISFPLKCISGEDTGEQVLYKNSSVGGLSETSKLIGAVMAQLDVDPSRPVPVIRLSHDSYPHKVYGKTYIPIFEIVKWVELSDDMPQVGETAKQPDPEPAPAEPARRRRAAAETGQPKPAETKPAETAAPQKTKAQLMREELERLEAEEAAAAAGGTDDGAPFDTDEPAPAQPEPIRRRRRA